MDGDTVVLSRVTEADIIEKPVEVSQTNIYLLLSSLHSLPYNACEHISSPFCSYSAILWTLSARLKRMAVKSGSMRWFVKNVLILVIVEYVSLKANVLSCLYIPTIPSISILPFLYKCHNIISYVSLILCRVIDYVSSTSLHLKALESMPSMVSTCLSHMKALVC